MKVFSFLNLIKLKIHRHYSCSELSPQSRSIENDNTKYVCDRNVKLAKKNFQPPRYFVNMWLSYICSFLFLSNRSCTLSKHYYAGNQTNSAVQVEGEQQASHLHRFSFTSVFKHVFRNLRPFKCTKCSAVFGRQGCLRRHDMMRHLNYVYICPYKHCTHAGFKCSKVIKLNFSSFIRRFTCKDSSLLCFKNKITRSLKHLLFSPYSERLHEF